jgi:acetate kinase
VTAEACKVLGTKPEETCLITAHLGNGSSCSAILNGQCVDTTMGFTPLEGLIMGTRSGSLDPAILFYIAKKYGEEYGTIDKLDHLVNKESGLLGLSGLSNDMRTLTQAASEGNKQAQIALDVFCYRLTREIGGIAMALPRIDAIVFTGGIGENSFYVRKQALDNLKLLGYQVDEERNLKSGKESNHLITKDGTPKAIVVATNEELLIALDTEALVK